MRRRAAAAGPYPRPSGRAPAGKTWDKESGDWVALDGSSTPEAVAITRAPVDDTSCEVVVTWEVPMVIPAAMDHVYEHTTSADMRQPCGNIATSRLHEHEQLTPRGSRAHTFEHTSPGGTTRLEQYRSPAGSRATAEERIAWRHRIACSRKEMRSRRFVQQYSTQCKSCGVQHYILPDGRMRIHSMRETIPSAQRPDYPSRFLNNRRDAYQCPGSHDYHGPGKEQLEGKQANGPCRQMCGLNLVFPCSTLIWGLVLQSFSL